MQAEMKRRLNSDDSCEREEGDESSPRVEATAGARFIQTSRLGHFAAHKRRILPGLPQQIDRIVFTLSG